MIKITRADEHYRNKTDWLDTTHHFSFGEYFDAGKMNFGPLRVFNDDIISAGRGFDFHKHSDMEIVTYVIDGTLEHKDGLGNTGVVSAGEVQRMSAGTGIMHSEYNGSKTGSLRLLQVWIFTNKKNLVPSYEQRKFSKEERLNKLFLVVAPDDTMTEKSLHIHQDVYFFVSSLSEGALLERKLDFSRKAYLFVIDGKVELNENVMKTRDAARIENEKKLSIEAMIPSELLLIDLPEKYAFNQ
ncbi:MAG TPA: pirin family protein [Nitrosopumilaceae archaeon]|nr:pirin family protein [Nitrosopumilaceae archaeon]